MKRDAQINKHNVYKYFGLFAWEECFFCKQEFRRESGFRWIMQGRWWAYSCSTCSISISHCNENIDHKFANMRAFIEGKPPVPPPMRSYNNARR